MQADEHNAHAMVEYAEENGSEQGHPDTDQDEE
jgi:hypothetical protein